MNMEGELLLKEYIKSKTIHILNESILCNEKITISESMVYHIKNHLPLHNTIHRYESNSFNTLAKEMKKLNENGLLKLTELDRELLFDIEIGLFEAEYKGKNVTLNKPMRGGSKKYYVYVKTDKGNIKKIEFGDTTGLSAKVSNQKARKSFSARHNCPDKKDKTKAGYWACRINKYSHLWGGKTYPGYW